LISRTSTKERRSHPRLENNVPVKIFSDDGDIVTETGNVSRSGAYCRINKYIEPMTKLKICLLLPTRKNGKVVTKKVSCQGVVVRTETISEENEFNVAIFFNDISQRDADIITEYISFHLEKENES
jgi:hypothetical protein